jgi:hypothetical protein
MDPGGSIKFRSVSGAPKSRHFVTEENEFDLPSCFGIRVSDVVGFTDEISPAHNAGQN